MKYAEKQFTEEEMNEPRVCASDLLTELKPLLEEYFIGDVTLDGNCITYTLPNGQRLKLSAGEVVI